ncbi:MAG: response regulator transcription factor [Flavobacterium sp.]|nr:MAG: response regulator transcription factor [Flavobacterium sp.]
MINCYVIGERTTVESLCAHIKNYSLSELLGYAMNFPADLQELYRLKPDVVFLDATMLPLDEELLNIIRGISAVIFVSKDAEMAFEAFEHLAFDYLLSPVSFTRFAKSIGKFDRFRRVSQPMVLHHSPASIESFFIKTDSKGFKEVLIRCDQLLYIQALQNYVVLHMVSGKRYSCHNSMKEMAESLSGSSFIRIHKSHIINEHQITSVEGNMVTLNNDESQKLLIGNTYRKSFFDRKNQRMIKKHKQSPPLLDFSQPASVFLGIGMFFYDLFVSAGLEGGLL